MNFYQENKDEILKEMVKKLKTMSDGEKTSTSELYKLLYPEYFFYHDETLWNIHQDLVKAAKKAGLILDMSHHVGLTEGMPYNLDYKVKKRLNSRKCPYCGATKLAKILYGMRFMNEGLMRDLKNHRIVLGGCCISDDDPEYQCVVCGEKF